jgi:hypothetical protein
VTDLERIEAKHRPSGVECFEDDEPYPCDVVKLARALDFIAKASEPCDSPEFCIHCEATSALHEVAGGDE